MVHRLPEKAGAGDSAHAYIPGQFLTELQVTVIAELGDIQQNIVSPLRVIVGDVQVIQSFQKQLFLMGVLGQQVIVVILTELQAGKHRFLQGRRSAHRQKIMYLFCPVNDLRRRDDVAKPSAGNGMLFAPCQYALPAVSAFCDPFGPYRQFVLLI